MALLTSCITCYNTLCIWCQVGIIFGGCFGRLLAELLVACGLIDAAIPGTVGMYALMGAGESTTHRSCTA